jgi:hypothetical protein
MQGNDHDQHVMRRYKQEEEEEEEEGRGPMGSFFQLSTRPIMAAPSTCQTPQCYRQLCEGSC